MTTACGNKMSGVCGDCVYLNKCRNSEIAKLPKTNIEWMREASIYEMADFLSNLAYSCMRCGMTNSKAYCYTNFCIQDKEDAMEWLKQPHQEE